MQHLDYKQQNQHFVLAGGEYLRDTVISAM